MHVYSEQETAFPLLLTIALALFQRPSPSGREDLMRTYVCQHLRLHDFLVEIDARGNVLAHRGTPLPGEGYPLLSFHLDCVSLERPSTIRPLPLRPPDSLVIERGWLHSRGRFVLGGDDKCGAAIALTLAATTSMPLKIVASVEEEIGCLGIEQVDPRFFTDVAYALVLDRRGANHLIVSIADQLLCEGTFAAALMRAAAETGLLVYAAQGSLSDALTLSTYISNVANLSVGYYAPHSVHERVSLPDLWHAYRWVKQALDSLPTHPSPLSPNIRPEALVCPRCGQLLVAPARVAPAWSAIVCCCAERAHDDASHARAL